MTLDGLSSAVTGVHLHGRACEQTGAAPVLVDLTPRFLAPRLAGPLATNRSSVAGRPVSGRVVSLAQQRPGMLVYEIEVVGDQPVDGRLAGAAAYDTPGRGGTEMVLSGGGAQVVPLPINTSARVEGTVRVTSPTTVVYQLTLPGLLNQTAAHFHLGRRGVKGPALINVTADGTPRTWVFPAANATAILDALRLGNVYFNAHSTGNPGGEVRAQLEFASHTLNFVRVGTVSKK